MSSASQRGWILPLVLTVLAGTGRAFEQPVQPYWQAPTGAFVHLFEWPWASVAKECEDVLGPAGYVGVQVSPPQEHILVDGDPWWSRYQPVSYQLEGRSGDRAAFADMVSRCSAAGVGVYVDVVINHMSGMEGGTGSGGSGFSHFEYPGIWQHQDFHHCGRYGDDDIRNYQDRWEVQTCELLNLADLDTGAPYVQQRIGEYLQDLRSLGVAGFRVDAAKHMAADEVAAVLGHVEGVPYVFQEVIDLGNEPIRAGEYFGSGAVTEFRYGFEIGRVFKGGKLAWMEMFGEVWGMMPSEKVVVFTDNHDNQRGHGASGQVLTFHDGRLYELANVFMLAWPYGYPKVMSSYDFSDGNQGPPLAEDRRSKPVHGEGGECTDRWKCEHRWQGMRAMAGFRKAVGHAPVEHWWSNGENQIAFARAGQGFVAINRGGELRRTFQTGLPAGQYRDVIRGGDVIQVNAEGFAEVVVPDLDARAFRLNVR